LRLPLEWHKRTNQKFSFSFAIDWSDLSVTTPHVPSLPVKLKKQHYGLRSKLQVSNRYLKFIKNASYKIKP
jgi:hypothetical protein